MLIILSQKVDTESLYSDELFNTYHYPARYKNQIHKGDVFIYYQGNRFDKEQRYYFGIGTIGEIISTDGENYYAKLLDCQRFERNVPIYLPDGGYIEQLDYEEVRKSTNPPWQSSIRPVSQKAFDYILHLAGVQERPDSSKSVDTLKEEMKQAIREFYLMGNDSAILEIESISSAIARSLNVSDDTSQANHAYKPAVSADEGLSQLVDYCKTMKMSYSYKPVLILALLSKAKKNGAISIEKATEFFRDYYDERRGKGLAAEKRKCIYLNPAVTDQQIAANIIANPVKALTETSFFYFNVETQEFSLSPEIWSVLDRKGKLAIGKVCRQRLNDYFAD